MHRTTLRPSYITYPLPLREGFQHCHQKNQSLKNAASERALESANIQFARTSLATPSQPQKNRSRNILWFNPPYSKINVGAEFKGKCLAVSIVYKATVSGGEFPKQYIGLVVGEFKSCYRNHVKSFKHRRYANETDLSKYIWELNDKGLKYSIKWEVLNSQTQIGDDPDCAICAWRRG